VKIIHSVAVAVLAAQLALQGAATIRAETTIPCSRSNAAGASPSDQCWLEAIEQLNEESRDANKCAARLKKYGDYNQKKDGERAYTSAKADSDELINGLIDALRFGKTPADRPDLQKKLNSSRSGLAEFCDAVDKLIPDTAGHKGQKDNLADIAKEIRSGAKKAWELIATLSNDYSPDDAPARGKTWTKLEDARWLTFSEVKEER
jgi:hypothetical protein